MADSTILVTGAAGFIGFHVSRRLLEDGYSVIGVDNLNDYYDPALKRARLEILNRFDTFTHVNIDLADRPATEALFAKHRFPYVIHLAAQAGVRYSLINPHAYIDSNIQGFTNILEGCRAANSRHLVFASSSSVYGSNTQLPFSVHQNVDHPISLYAATKKSNELMAHCYSHLFKLPITGLRFFTVYGPWGRPDMAMFIFASAILAGKPIRIFNHGDMRRDFTYVDDVVESVVRLVKVPASPNLEWSGKTPDPGTSSAPWRIYNIGNNNPTELMRVVELLENELGRTAIKEFEAIQPGDVPATYADVNDLMNDIGFRPSTSIEDGIRKFVAWYKEYHAV